MSGTRLTCKKFDWSRRVFQLGPPSLLLGLMAQASLEEFQLSAPVAPRRRRHLPSSRPGSLRWSAPSPIEIGLGCDATFFSVPNPTPPCPSRTAAYEPVRARTIAPPAVNTQFCLARVFPGGRCFWRCLAGRLAKFLGRAHPQP